MSCWKHPGLKATSPEAAGTSAPQAPGALDTVSCWAEERKSGRDGIFIRHCSADAGFDRTCISATKTSVQLKLVLQHTRSTACQLSALRVTGSFCLQLRESNWSPSSGGHDSTSCVPFVDLHRKQERHSRQPCPVNEINLQG